MRLAALRLIGVALCAPLALVGGTAYGGEPDREATRRKELQQAVELVRTGDSREKAMALGYLGLLLNQSDYFSDPSALKPILRATGDKDPRVREAAFGALDTFFRHTTGFLAWHDARNLPVPGKAEVLAAMKDPSPRVRLEAMRIGLGGQEEPLISALKDADPWVRVVAAAKIPIYDPKHGFALRPATAALLPMLEDRSDRRFRFAKALTLRKLQGHTDPRVPPVLIRVAAADPDLRRLALGILWSIENIKAHRLAGPPGLAGVERTPDGRSIYTGRRESATPPGQPARPTGPPSWWEPAYVPIFLGFLQDKDPSVRASAAGFLALSYDPTTIPALVDALKDPDPTVRTNVIFHLGPLAKDPRMTARVQQATSDPDPRVRQEALRALGTVTVPSVAVLTALLQDPDLKVRKDALQTIHKVTTGGGAAAQAAALGPLLPTILWLARDNDPGMRSAALVSLEAYRGDAGVRRVLIEAARDPDRGVRSAAVSVLTLLPEDPDARRALIEAVKDPYWTVHHTARLRLEQEQVPEYIDFLLDQVRRSNQPPEYVIGSLGALRVRRAIPDLIRLAGPQAASGRVRGLAAGALATIWDPAAVEPLMAAARSAFQAPPAERRQSLGLIMEALARFRDPRAVPLFVELSHDADESTRHSALVPLATLGGPLAEGRLAEIAKDDPAPGVRMYAQQLLAGRANRRTPAKLFANLSHTDAQVRADAAQSLGLLRERGVIDALLDLLPDRSPTFSPTGTKESPGNSAEVALRYMVQPEDAERIKRRLATETHPEARKFLESLIAWIAREGGATK